MNNITFALYKGKEYSAGIKENGQIVLRSKDVKETENGFFEKVAGNERMYIKYVSRSEIEEVYDRRTIARYEGHDFEVIDETDKEISIVAMAGDYRDWLNLGMKVIDKGVYQKWIPKEDAEIRVIKEPL